MSKLFFICVKIASCFVTVRIKVFNAIICAFIAVIKSVSANVIALINCISNATNCCSVEAKNVCIWKYFVST